MTKINDGGNAYPREMPNLKVQPDMVEKVIRDRGGMTLRQLYAAKFGAAMVAGEGARMVADRDRRYDETNWDYIVASNSFNMADAFIAFEENERAANGESDASPE